MSADSVMNALDKSKYEIVPVGITKSGRWIAGEQALQLLKHGVEDTPFYTMLPADPCEQRLLPTMPATETCLQRGGLGDRLDVVFPVLHGPCGEDGTVQGLLELSGLPYVGAGVLGSAVCMDKVVQKILCRQAGCPVVDFLWFHTYDQLRADRKSREKPIAANPQQIVVPTIQAIAEEIEARLHWPVFVKPANMGSSVGIHKVHNRRELVAAVEDAAQYDHKILVEAAVLHPREIEVGVLGNADPKASVTGEVIPSGEFYDYNAKYVDGSSSWIIPAEIPAAISEAIRETAVRGYLACSGDGMARVDFLLERESGRFYLNEINTIPGFTQISMYPKLWEAGGVPYPRLLDELIQQAIERHERKEALENSYHPKKEWYR